MKLRKTARKFYYRVTIFGALGVLMGLNFLAPFLPPPTFEQYAAKEIVGTFFLAIGTALLVAVNSSRRGAVRAALFANILLCLFWGFGTTQTAFEGTSSFQLFLLYWTLAALQVPLFLTPDEDNAP